MPVTAANFLDTVKDGTCDESTRIGVWHLVRTLGGSAKIDITSPKEGWPLTVRGSPDVR